MSHANVDELADLARQLTKLGNNKNRALIRTGTSCSKLRKLFESLRVQPSDEMATDTHEKQVQEAAQALYGQALLINNAINRLNLCLMEIKRNKTFIKLAEESDLVPSRHTNSPPMQEIPTALKRAVNRMNVGEI